MRRASQRTFAGFGVAPKRSPLPSLLGRQILEPWDFLTRKDEVFKRLEGLEF